MTRRKRRRIRKIKLSTRLKRKFKRACKRNRWVVALAFSAILGYFYVHWSFSSTNFSQDKGHYNTSLDFDGIDVSKYQGNIDWKSVAVNGRIQFVYIKASEGSRHVDSKYKRNVKEAKAAGLKVGSYHFFIGRKSAKEQFDNFNRSVDRYSQDLIPVVDVEEAGNRNISRAQLQSNLQEFMDLVKKEYGKYPILYSQYGFYNKMLAPEFNRYYIFIARYGSQKPELKGNGKYNIWQYSEKGHVDGIKGHVDMNRFANGTTLFDIEL